MTEKFVRGRLYRRSDTPTLGFFPLGLLATALVAGVFVFGVTRGARVWVEADVRRAVERALDAAGLNEVGVEVSGRSVRLVRAAPSPSEAERALAQARSARSDTWMGALASVAHVEASFAGASAPTPVSVLLTLSSGALHLQGRVPDEHARVALIAAAERVRATSSAVHALESALEVAAVRPSQGWVERSTQAVEALSRCYRGQARIQPGRLDLECLADRSQAAAIEKVGAGIAGAVKVVIAAEAAECERKLGELLALRPVRFRVGEPDLEMGSSSVLDDLAHLLRECPGRLRLLAWARQAGPFSSREALGLARARALVDALASRGLPPSRFELAGAAERPLWGTPSWNLTGPLDRVSFKITVGFEPARP